MSEFVLVNFECIFLPAGPNTSVHVVGDHPALGCWNTAQSVQLFRRDDAWETRTPVSLPSGSFEYKYIVFTDGRFDRWEAFDGNRCLVASGEALTMCDTLDHNQSRASAVDLVHVSSSTVSLTQGAGAGSSSSPTVLSESPAVLVVSYILPLLISHDGDEWDISWNADAITAKVRA